MSKQTSKQELILSLNIKGEAYLTPEELAAGADEHIVADGNGGYV